MIYMRLKTLSDFEWRGKIAVVRADLNVPLTADGDVADDARMQAAAPTVQAILDRGGGAVMLSHLGRPAEGAVDAALSLAPVAAALCDELQMPVRFVRSLAEAEAGSACPGEVLLLENTRFNRGEKANDMTLARRYAALGDVFVMDAFASSHRAEASVEALARCGIPVCAGALMTAELEALERVSKNIARPLVGVFGGAKISTKLSAVRRMAALCDELIIGGGMANTLLLAQGVNVGESLAQAEMADEALAVLEAAGERVLLPHDAVVGGRDASSRREIPLAAMTTEDRILDIGAGTCAAFAETLDAAKTIMWNGPMGLFEQPGYAAGTFAVARAIAASPAYSLIGGADTIAAARGAGVLERFSHVCTGGGAMLDYLAGEPMPGIAALAA